MSGRIPFVTEREAGFWSWTVALAVATVLMLEAMRVFVGYLVFVVDQSQRGLIAAIVLAVFLLPLATIPLSRSKATRSLIREMLLLIAAGRAATMLFDQPVLRLVLAVVIIAGWSWFTVLLIARQRNIVAFGLPLGLGLDLAIRIALAGNDLPFASGIGPAVASLALILTLIVAALRLPAFQESATGTMRQLLPVAALGPALALFHMVSGSPAFAEVKADVSPALAALLLSAGLALGLGIGSLRAYALAASQAGSFLALRFIVFDIGIGGFALWTVWNASDLRLLGIIFVVATSMELLLFALLPTSAGQSTSASAAPVAVTGAMLLQFAILFPYYSTSSSGWMLAIAWLLLSVGALGNALLPGERVRWPAMPVRSFAPPIVAVVLIALIATGWQFANDHAPSGDVLPPEITVMSFNIQAGFARDARWDLEAVAQVIEESNADIVLLQEVGRGWLATAGNDQLRWLERRLNMQAVWGPSSDDGLWGNAILTRGSVADDFRLQFETTENLKRSAVGALIETERGLIIAISTHLDNPIAASATRDTQVGQLLELWDGHNPTIIGGDFNATPDDPVIQRVIKSGLTDSGAELPAETTTSRDGRRIDYIFYSEHYELLSIEVLETDVSDHRPVVATFEIIDRR